MSLVSTYVRAVDGKLYKNPVMRGRGWFLCFDDADPPELVVREGQTPPGLHYFRRSRRQSDRSGYRCFGGKNSHAFEAATAYFGTLVDRIPVPKDHEGTFNREEIMQGVFYDLKPRSPKKKPGG